MSQTTLDFAESFPDNNRETWEALLVAGQKASPELIADALSKITKTTIDGINLQALYDQGFSDDHGAATESGVVARSARRGSGNSKPWDIRQVFRNPDPALSNKEILQELERGTTSIHLVLQQVASDSASGAGIALRSPEDLNTLLQGVYPELITTAFEPAASAHDAIEWYFQLTQKHKVKAQEVRLACNLDPFAGATDATTPNNDISVNTDAMVALAKRCVADFPAVTTAAVDTKQWHNLGANTVQELAIACSTGVHHLKAMLASGIDLTRAQQQIVFHLAVDADFFTGITKLRAMRELWAYICQQFASGDSNNPAATQQATIHAHSSQRMLSRLDADNNQLRNTLACSAAAIGGADCISVEAHHSNEQQSYPLQQPDEFSRRIARNIQLVLQEESNLHRVADPLGGSPFIESLTSELVASAWQEFQKMESLGGMQAAISTGALSDDIGKTQGSREQQLATRKSPLVGVSEFASIDQPAFEHSACANPSLKRSSQPFESLRIASWQFEKTHGHKPAAILLNLGEPKDYRGRSGFSRNFLAASGLDGVEFESANLHKSDTDFDKQIENLGEALLSASTHVLLVCSSDTVYEELAAEFFNALRKAGAAHLVIAGRRKTLADGSLCDDEIYLGCHALEKLQAIHRSLGIEVLPDGSIGDAS